MQRAIGMDIHRTIAEVVFWEAGRLRPAGRIDMTRSGLEGFGRGLSKEDEVVVEATGNAMGVVRVLSPYVARGRSASDPEERPNGRQPAFLDPTAGTRQSLPSWTGESQGVVARCVSHQIPPPSSFFRVSISASSF